MDGRTFSVEQEVLISKAHGIPISGLGRRGIDADGVKRHMLDARQIDAHIVADWNVRFEQTPHPIPRSLAAVLGIAPSTIYGHMRAGRFVLPYRMLNASHGPRG